MSLNEADTCRVLVTPKLRAAGWEEPPHLIAEQHTFTAGRVRIVAGQSVRGERKRADYFLLYTQDLTLAVVEAKPEDAPEGTGLAQSKGYAQLRDLKFAYATNGHWIVEFDFLTGTETSLTAFPTPAALFARLQAAAGLGEEATRRLLTPAYQVPEKPPRYYQEIAIDRTVRAILGGQTRILFCMATGTGKTTVAFQICWKLWTARWTRDGTARKPRSLFLADRNILVDDPKDKDFAPFGNARWKIEGGRAQLSREMYFATYQSLAKDKVRPGLYRQYPRDFFDLVIVDECHRGSAADESNWREILEWFEPAYQLGMTATPQRAENRDTYRYFGNPVYSYSLRDGIEDGFLAPYRVHRVVTDVDATGWRPTRDELDRFGRAIPDGLYETRDFERSVVLKARTQAVAKHLTDFMRRTDRWAKTIVFCVDQEHAAAMRQALTNLNQDLVAKHPHYVERVTSDEGETGRGFLSNFQDPEETTPVILTTSQMLTTGVDVPTCKNIVLVRVINSLTEFKQIIGRGTRLREDYGKTWFNIIDYTGSATARFADPDFDGYPDAIDETEIDGQGNETGTETIDPTTQTTPQVGEAEGETDDDGPVETPGPGEIEEPPPRKYYVDGGAVKIIGHVVYELDGDGQQLRVIQYTDYTAAQIRTLFRSADALTADWADPVTRETLLARLELVGIRFADLADATGTPDADPLDLLCHLAFQRPLRTRRERAEHLRRQRPDFFDQHSAAARGILDTLLDQYMEHGPAEFQIPQALKHRTIAAHGNAMEIADLFGGPLAMRQSVNQLQALLYTDAGAS
ncbi:EcoAI/FtnUII family type I restriction enzme subunit R [uncultured Thiodictyon sp.]|uniref:EcoAI/FtnUII family type I restriction enzme subunit R n=1 Tax=uncultured Thiodictyon sp. TaxID=1846217 RepID=UPI0025DD8E19|nr:DEAD/DEAH box helicase family protein [uncultured Thiodictyon sp.]